MQVTLSLRKACIPVYMGKKYIYSSHLTAYYSLFQRSYDKTINFPINKQCFDMICVGIRIYIYFVFLYNNLFIYCNTIFVLSFVLSLFLYS